MRFSLVSVLAFAATALAQTPGFVAVISPKANEVLQAGSPYTITWQKPTEAKYQKTLLTIELLGGDTQGTQVVLQSLATGVSYAAGSYTVDIPSDGVAKAVNGFRFIDESDPQVFQYSPPFQIKPSGPKSSSSSSGPKSSSSTSGSASATSSIKTVTLSSVSTSMTANSTSAKTSAHTHSSQHKSIVPGNSTTAVKTSSQSAPVVVSTGVPRTAVSSTAVFTTGLPTPTVPVAAANALHVGSLTMLGVVAAVLAL
ncbi:Cell wall beta-glucan synthesis [Metarhizium album ARSEF 1941]|uniref:Cell wall beta-glucan synthesis n=1 Tax=Metarhizium album (strain ARSEF 1941) TaxID=1081103 RepID=A0A0B2X2Y1_METAS|nr:Cell wall beta-glucan synthesis [Metarhizium album ARSEF 1941]KHO00118.1 Cell wall beta-glucan synthesis [Metarhizium album ARSEF 1941]